MMEHRLTALKAAAAACLTAVCSFLGWRGVLGLVWVLAMGVDYLSGTAAACKAGQWSSAKAREGLWHKGGCILVVTVAAMGDGILGTVCRELNLGIRWPGAVLPLVLVWYILTESGSVLENAVALGAPVPKWLTKLLKTSLQAVDERAEEAEKC